MLKINNHQGNVNQKHTPVRMAIRKMTGINNCWEECGAKETHSHITFGENATWCSHYGKLYGRSSKN